MKLVFDSRELCQGLIAPVQRCFVAALDELGLEPIAEPSDVAEASDGFGRDAGRTADRHALPSSPRAGQIDAVAGQRDAHASERSEAAQEAGPHAPVQAEGLEHPPTRERIEPRPGRARLRMRPRSPEESEVAGSREGEQVHAEVGERAGAASEPGLLAGSRGSERSGRLDRVAELLVRRMGGPSSSGEPMAEGSGAARLERSGSRSVERVSSADPRSTSANGGASGSERVGSSEPGRVQVRPSSDAASEQAPVSEHDQHAQLGPVSMTTPRAGQEPGKAGFMTTAAGPGSLADAPSREASKLERVAELLAKRLRTSVAEPSSGAATSMIGASEAGRVTVRVAAPLARTVQARPIASRGEPTSASEVPTPEAIEPALPTSAESQPSQERRRLRVRPRPSETSEPSEPHDTRAASDASESNASSLTSDPSTPAPTRGSSVGRVSVARGDLAPDPVGASEPIATTPIPAMHLRSPGRVPVRAAETPAESMSEAATAEELRAITGTDPSPIASRRNPTMSALPGPAPVASASSPALSASSPATVERTRPASPLRLVAPASSSSSNTTAPASARSSSDFSETTPPLPADPLDPTVERTLTAVLRNAARRQGIEV